MTRTIASASSSRTTWAEVVATLAAETDYDHVKSAVARHQGPAGAGYERALHEVWGNEYNLRT